MRRAVLTGLFIAAGMTTSVFARAAGCGHIVRRLQSPDVAERYAAAEALTDLGPLAAPAVPQLVEAMKSTDADCGGGPRGPGAIGPVEAAKESAP